MEIVVPEQVVLQVSGPRHEVARRLHVGMLFQ